MIEQKELRRKVMNVLQRVVNNNRYTDDDIRELQGLYYTGVNDVREGVKEALGIEDAI